MKKSIIIVLLIIGIYLLIAIFGLDLLDSITNKYIYIDNVGFKYSNGKWSNIKIDNDILKKYELYLPNSFEYVGKYDIRYNNKWYYNFKKTFETYDDFMFALKGKNIKVYKYDINYEITDYKIKDILSQNNLNYNALNMEKEIHIDLDNNGQIDVIYALSNVYSEEIEDILFSAIVLKLNGEYNIVKVIKNNDEVLLNVFAIFDINNDKKLELIISEEGYSLNGNTYSIYGLKNNQYNELVKS